MMRYLKLLRSSILAPRVLPSAAWTVRSSRFLSQDAAAAGSSSPTRYDPLQSRNDMEDLFLDKRVRYLLKRLTGYDYLKVFGSKAQEDLYQANLIQNYNFMDSENLARNREKANEQAKSVLQMPPVKYVKEFQPKILEKDPALEGYLDSSVKVIFVDATPGYSDIERLIVVREADGTLREATQEERHRSNQIFYPVEERGIELPKMLEDTNIENVLKRGAYKLLLDIACLHLEPEDRRYIDLCHRVYDHIASKNWFDKLQYTRHYGGMVYYYAYYRRADPMLHYLVTENRLEEALHLLHLYYVVNPREGVPVSWELPSTEMTLSQLAELSQQPDKLISVSLEQFINLFKFYVTNDATNLSVKPRLQLNLQKLQEQLANEQFDDSASVQN